MRRERQDVRVAVITGASAGVGRATAQLLARRGIAIALLDRYLARTGYDSQQTGGPADPDRPTNLWRPADGPDGEDYGAQGSFTGRSHSRSLQAWLSRHRLVTAAGLAGAAVGALAWRRH